MLSSRCSLLLAALLGVALGGRLRAAGAALAPTSPFLPASAAGAGPAAENTPLELRGIMMDAGGYRFSIYDPVHHTGTWSRLNEPGHDFVVRAHDVAHDIVTIDFQGRILTLPMHTSKVSSAPAAPAPMVNAAPGNSPAVLNPTPADEIARFNRVKEELARRRALREQAAKQGR